MKLEFVADACETVDRLSRRLAALERGDSYPRHLTDSLFRTAHSLRGTAGMFGLDEVSRIAGSLENLLDGIRTQRIGVNREVVDLVVEVLDEISILLRREQGQEPEPRGQALNEKIERFLRSYLAEPGAPKLEGPRHRAAASKGEAPHVEPSPVGTPISGIKSDLTKTPAPTQEPEARDRVLAPSPLAVKVDIALLDSIMNTISELFSTRLALSGIAKKLPPSGDTRRLGDDLLKVSYLLNKRMLDLQTSVVEARLVPMSMLFDRYTGEARRLARLAGKNIELVCEGEATRVDRALLDKLYDPLLHVIRNAVDHGIEPSDERTRLGKPMQGKIVLRAGQETGHIRIDVEDDGRGIDIEDVKRVARTKGIAVNDREAALELLFQPGFSTKEKRSEISGRGVGLDAVRTQVEILHGMVSLVTQFHQGTKFSMWVPLTLAVSRGMLVQEGSVPVAIPLACVMEVLRATKEIRDEAERSGRIDYRGTRIAAARLSQMLKTHDSAPSRSVVVVGIGERRGAILVQQVRGETEIVSRPLPEVMTVPAFITGATELHDGRPAIIIWPEVLRRECEPALKPGGSSNLAEAAGPPFDNEPRRGWPQRCVLVRRDGAMYAVAFRLLKEMLPASHVTEVPALGEAWEGVFFVRGLCHALARLPDSVPSRDWSHMKIITFNSPERCGIGVEEAIGDYEVSFENIEPASGHTRGVLATVGTFRLRGESVKVLDVGMMPRPVPRDDPRQRRELTALMTAQSSDDNHKG
jgi:two-component system chemotaxis sensor kinase CheA